MLIRARAPLRLGLAGGGSDVSPYCDVYGGYVLNATIDRYAYAVLKPMDGNLFRIRATDRSLSQDLDLNLYPFELNGKLDLHKAVYNHMIHFFNSDKPLGMELSTFCDAPVGSGLGASSTIVVAMIRAFVEYFNLPLDDYEIAGLAYKIERIDCALQGGRQDQFSATFGGFNFMEFYDNDRAVINPLRLKNWIINELEASLLFFYTGTSRESAKIIADQSNNLSSGSQDALEAMHGLKQEALIMKECILKGDMSGIVHSMRQGWENKKKSAKSVSNLQIDNIYDAALNAGALAGKVSGAGGGGFMIFFVDPEKRIEVYKALEKFPGVISNCHFTKYGSQAWKIL
jgi:D-glycero-alpha-D-manno-heptose-7-phosphate kinase